MDAKEIAAIVAYLREGEFDLIRRFRMAYTLVEVPGTNRAGKAADLIESLSAQLTAAIKRAEDAEEIRDRIALDMHCARGQISADAQMLSAAQSQLAAVIKRAEEAERQWRCFQCDETFTDRDAALEHFGPHCLCDTACQIDIKKYREMEVLHERELAEDSDSHRKFYSMQADHAQALIREEQKGYDKGVAVWASVWASARATIAKLKEESAWRPIESVSEDDRRAGFFLLFSPTLVDADFNPIGVVEGYWQDGEGWIGAVWNNDQDCWDAESVTPTLFRPLPAPPSELTT